MATFGTAEEADAEQKKLEEAARTLVNPFAGEAAPAEQSNMPEPILCDWLRDHGIEPPQVGAQSGTREWSEWWDESCRNWSVEQRAAVWEALDRVRFFEAVEEPNGRSFMPSRNRKNITTMRTPERCAPPIAAAGGPKRSARG